MNVLDHGFVELIDHMGDDLTIVKAARTSYGGEGHMIDPALAERLLSTLLQQAHGTPFEHVVFTFYVRAPEMVFRQWVRHRIGSFNVQSRRYTQVGPEEFYVPNTVNQELIREHYQKCLELYQALRTLGHKPETARLVLPGYAVYSNFYWTVNARSLMNFLTQRLDSHAQWEIQQYAQVVDSFFAEVLPITHRLFHKESV